MTTALPQPACALARPAASPHLLCASIHAACLALYAGSAHAQATPPTQNLAEISVTARAERIAPATIILGTTELEKRNAIDMAGIARYEPLISVPSAASGGGSVWDGAGSTGFNIRGIEGNRVSLDIDGISLPDAAPKPDGTSMNAFGIGRDYIDPAMLREVRIGSGTSAAGAGTPGLGGSVAFVTKSPEDYLGGGKDRYLDYALGYSGASAARSHALTGAARLGVVQALAVYAQRSGEAQENMGSVAPNPDDWNSKALLVKFNWAPLPGQRLGLTLDSYRRDNARQYVNKTSALYPEGTRQDSSTRRDRISISHQLERAPGGPFDTLETKLYHQDARVEDLTHARYFTGNQPYQREIATGLFNKSTGAQADATLALSTATSLAYGLAWNLTATSRPWLERRLVIATGATQVTSKNRMADMDTDKASAWLRADFGFTLGGLAATFTPGLRTEYRKLTPTSTAGYLVAVPGAAAEIKTESDAYTVPSLKLAVMVAPDTQLYASATRGARLPTAAERTGSYDSFSYTGAGNGYAVLGNAALKKETSTALEAGLKGSPLKGLDVGASVFRNNYSNFIDYVTQAPDPVNYPTITFGLYRPENNGSARTWGGEASLGARLGTWFDALAGVSLHAAAGIARGSAFNSATGKKGELASTLPRKASLSLAWDAPQDACGIALAATATAGKQPADDVIAGVTTPRWRIPGAAVADLTAYWRLGQHARLNLGLYNLGDKRYWDYASSRALPAGTTTAAMADIERSTRPGRSMAATFTVQY